MMKTGKNNRFLASILAASMMLTMSPFAFAAADTAEQKEMTAQEQVQSATQNETNANPTVSQMDSQSSEDTNSEALKTKDQSSEGTNSGALKTEGQPSEGTNSEALKTEGQPSEDVKTAGRTPLQEAAHRRLRQNRKHRKALQRSTRKSTHLLLTRLLMHSRTTPSFCSVMLRKISPSISL